MKKKNGFKSWLIRTLRKWLNKLEPEKTFRVEHVQVPLVTLNSVVTVPKDYMSEERITEILSKKLSDDVAKYMNIDTCEHVDWDSFDRQITYRATVRVAADKRG